MRFNKSTKIMPRDIHSGVKQPGPIDWTEEPEAPWKGYVITIWMAGVLVAYLVAVAQSRPEQIGNLLNLLISTLTP